MRKTQVKGRKVGGTRYKARSRGRSSPDTLAFFSLRNAQTIEPTTACICVKHKEGSGILGTDGCIRSPWLAGRLENVANGHSIAFDTVCAATH